MKIHIFADFNNRDTDDSVRLTTVGSEEDIAKFANEIADGMEIVLYDEEIELEARLKRDTGSGIWLGIPNWSTRRTKQSS